MKFLSSSSATSLTGRVELQTVLDFLSTGDVLTVTRIDRLARSIGDLQDIVRAVRAKGASLRATEQPIDTSTAAGKAFLDMLGVFAEFETTLRKERQLEGFAKAKAEGVYKGRKPSVNTDQVRLLKAQGMGPGAIAKQLKSAGLQSIGHLQATSAWVDRSPPLVNESVPAPSNFRRHITLDQNITPCQFFR